MGMLQPMWSLLVSGLEMSLSLGYGGGRGVLTKCSKSTFPLTNRKDLPSSLWRLCRDVTPLGICWGGLYVILMLTLLVRNKLAARVFFIKSIQARTASEYML